MDLDDLHSYKQQLIHVNNALSTCYDEVAKEELLALKNTIEELLSLTEGSKDEYNDVPTSSKNDTNDSNDEYALFMAEMEKAGAVDKHTEEHESPLPVNVKDIEGKKCRAPHRHHWGNIVYHNAMICSLESSDTDDEIKVRVLYTHPTHQEMMPCPYYYDSDCKFSEEKCRFSHGEIVSYCSLQEYIEPRFENLTTGSIVLAKQTDNLWYRAIVKEIYEDKCLVKFESDKKQIEVNLEETFPLNSENDESGDISEVEEDTAYNDKNDEDVINQSLMVTPSNVPLGNWEKHTKGLGSKLMAKMGYIIGTGLGKRSDGRIDPVSAVVLPAGKSLDHCMKLREQSGGDENLFNAERRFQRLQKKREKHNKKLNDKKSHDNNVFNFINKTLEDNDEDTKKGRLGEWQQVKQECSRNLNIKSLQLAESIRRSERALEILNESLSRNTDVTSSIHNKLKDKLVHTQNQLRSYHSQAELIKNEQSFRKDKKKMTIF
ncbi:unnamed protein product [Phaedon cochleariae]|uniref:Zinc finger CCCH-type with G patch domain-containing protein n=1 Tax=Phaedon cochleariae TaxID=80249 RepID=A0A9P0GL67_PHACE|nr:unnamed protein product [Phaedon cochleariae]